MKGLKKYCHNLKKYELHAHLKGSIRLSTIEELIDDESKIQKIKSNNLNCFEKFKIIREVINDLKVIKRITKEVLEDFEEDNVIYCELRTCPRKFNIGTNNEITEEEYVNTVIEGIIEYQNEAKLNRKNFVECKLLLSINRELGTEHAIKIVELTKKFMLEDNYIIGIDFSGNPEKNNFADYSKAFEMIKKSKIPCSIHIGEVENPNEIQNILDFKPDRLGHALKLTNNQIKKLLDDKEKIPIEICPSSNINTLGIKDLSEHPNLKKLLDNNYPISINTDDKSVFNTTLSNEYYLFAKTFKLNKDEIERICSNVKTQILKTNDFNQSK